MQSAEILTRSLGGRWFGHRGQAPCPKCQPEKRPDQHALSIKMGENGRLLLWCFKAGCSFQSIIAASCPHANGLTTGVLDGTVHQKRNGQAETEKRAHRALAVWNSSGPIYGTVAETYLRGRGITCDLPDTLRFHPEALHGPTSRRLPALIARVDGGATFAVHRTYLRADGAGKAPVVTPKAMLGACSGGAVQLTSAPSRLVVAEGIETALSLASGLLDGPATIWAALSTSGMRALSLPAGLKQLTIAYDGDASGHAAALALAKRAHASGFEISLLDPGDGRDFNDLLLGGTPS